MYRGESKARPVGMQSQQLLTQSEILKDEVVSRTESTDGPSQKMSERRDDGQNHGQNLIETDHIKPVSKLFILPVHEVLTRDNPEKATPEGVQAKRGIGCV
jgi:hypothetical protein